MSWWIWPTTADVGIRVFSPTKSSLIDDIIIGMQSVVLPPNYEYEDDLVISEKQWFHPNDRDLDRLIVRILEEVLYMCEVNDQWVISSKTRISEDDIGIIFTYVNENCITRDVQIKAITRHNLEAMYLEIGESDIHTGSTPEMIGPGWYGSVVFDL